MNTMFTLEQLDKKLDEKLDAKLDEKFEKFADRIEKNIELKIDEKIDELAGMVAREFRHIDQRFDRIEAQLSNHEIRIVDLEDLEF